MRDGGEAEETKRGRRKDKFKKMERQKKGDKSEEKEKITMNFSGQKIAQEERRGRRFKQKW